MRHLLIPLVIFGCLVALVFACFGEALLRGGQFAYRDAAHFYYPLYQRVQAEWEAGRLPLWEIEENGGMPLLGNPTAAVLYPGKVLYALFPYAWGARLYIVAHTLLAFAGMLVLMRSWGTSLTGGAIAALGYAFGMPILFQYCNIIFLVGAAWLPLGLRAVDRWLRLGRRWGLIELAVVLAMQTLGGDPEAAYVLGVCAAGYALALARLSSRDESTSAPAPAPTPDSRRPMVRAMVVTLVVWVGTTFLLAAWLPSLRAKPGPGKPMLAVPGMEWVPPGVACAWGLVGVSLLDRWRRRGWRSRLGTMLAGLIAAAVLAGALTAVQLLPVLEFTGQSGRAAGQGPHDVFPFSLEPIRLVEFLWPNVFGTAFHGNRLWLWVIPPARLHAEVWVPSLYLGGLTILLALGTLGFRGGPPWRGWLSAIAIVSLLASLGDFTGPLYWARWFPACVAFLGPHDPHNTTTIRLDGYLRDGDGSVYWLLATALPGFRQFRFPSKLLTFTTLALAGLAGLGWDRLLAASATSSGGERRLLRIGGGLLAVTLIGLAAVTVGHQPIVSALRKLQEAGHGSGFGPLDPAGSYQDLRSAFVQAAVVLATGLALLRWGGRSAGFAGVAALLVTTVDLALANASHVITVPQELMETTPRVVRLIEEAERRDPSPGPYRVHRMPLWNPSYWRTHATSDRVRDFVVWERDTIQPKYGLAYKVEYTLALGVAELYDYEWFFGGFLRTADADVAHWLGVNHGEKVVVYPRRAFDFWNTRYFLLPAFPNGWKDEFRAFAAFLPHTEPIYPDPQSFQGPRKQELQKRWLEREDFQILRNLSAYPRAWVVHEVRGLKPITGLERSDRDAPMQELLYGDEPLWRDPGRVVFDPRLLAWVDTDKLGELRDYLPRTWPSDAERVTVAYPDPQHVELDALLEQPGLVVLADVYYPGWKLTIDGAEAPIYRANRMMRGAAVPAGRHHLVYTYEPRAFAHGGWITLAALAVLAALGVAFTLRPVSSRLMPPGPAGPPSTPLPPATGVVE